MSPKVSPSQGQLQVPPKTLDIVPNVSLNLSPSHEHPKTPVRTPEQCPQGVPKVALTSSRPPRGLCLQVAQQMFDFVRIIRLLQQLLGLVAAGATLRGENQKEMRKKGKKQGKNGGEMGKNEKKQAKIKEKKKDKDGKRKKRGGRGGKRGKKRKRRKKMEKEGK